ncbi:unnamed protein product [Didymodactylos carnosus]|uniref:Uncharacterized protein n=1 Tax=Didymodactylos carnosus TaxID=1234261 RepID=A0A815CQ87_9BILA|nr:unnamed protein product [Didymodactylos carnosus]CAF4088097.1 unnamed protein product [Didymodactylos carnosus]
MAITGYSSFELVGQSGLLHGKGTLLYYRFLSKGHEWIWLKTKAFVSLNNWTSKPEYFLCNHQVCSYGLPKEDLAAVLSCTSNTNTSNDDQEKTTPANALTKVIKNIDTQSFRNLLRSTLNDMHKRILVHIRSEENQLKQIEELLAYIDKYEKQQNTQSTVINKEVERIYNDLLCEFSGGKSNTNDINSGLFPKTGNDKVKIRTQSPLQLMKDVDDENDDILEIVSDINEITKENLDSIWPHGDTIKSAQLDNLTELLRTTPSDIVIPSVNALESKSAAHIVEPDDQPALTIPSVLPSCFSAHQQKPFHPNPEVQQSMSSIVNFPSSSQQKPANCTNLSHSYIPRSLPQSLLLYRSIPTQQSYHTSPKSPVKDAASIPYYVPVATPQEEQ